MLTSKEIKIIIDTLMPFKPQRIGVFGSVARNEEKSTSDIDILYLFNTPVTLFNLVDMQNILQKQLNKSVDLVSEKAIHHLLKNQINKDLKIIYGE
jgi:predicted nucleotidyltransferase